METKPFLRKPWASWVCYLLILSSSFPRGGSCLRSKLCAVVGVKLLQSLHLSLSAFPSCSLCLLPSTTRTTFEVVFSSVNSAVWVWSGILALGWAGTCCGEQIILIRTSEVSGNLNQVLLLGKQRTRTAQTTKKSVLYLWWWALSAFSLFMLGTHPGLESGRGSPHHLGGRLVTCISTKLPILGQPSQVIGLATWYKGCRQSQHSLLIHLGPSLCHPSLSMGDVCVAMQGQPLTPRGLAVLIGKALFARDSLEAKLHPFAEQPSPPGLQHHQSRWREGTFCCERLQLLYSCSLA